MKIKIEIVKNIDENEIVIKCNEIDDDIINLQKQLLSLSKSYPKPKIALYKRENEFYFSPNDLLFFETDSGKVFAHIENDSFETTHKLYELEEMLPKSFVRVSKSTIVNTKKIYSINKNIASASLVKFRNTYKQIYVSRRYFNTLKNNLS